VGSRPCAPCVCLSDSVNASVIAVNQPVVGSNPIWGGRWFYFELSALLVDSSWRRFGENDQISTVFNSLEENGGRGKKGAVDSISYVGGQSLTFSGPASDFG
jgi:hypothetical protein